VMAGKVCKIPGHRRVADSQYLCAIDQSDVIKLRATNSLRLHDPEQASFMQIPLGFRWQATQLFGPRGTIAKLRNECSSPADHGCIGPAIGISSQNLASAWLSTNTRHELHLRLTAVGYLAFVYRAISN